MRNELPIVCDCVAGQYVCFPCRNEVSKQMNEFPADKMISLIYPENRVVSATMVKGWIDDAIANDEIPANDFDGSLESALFLLEDIGAITVGRRN